MSSPAGLPELRAVSLYGPGLTETVLAKLRPALPQCRVNG